MKKGRPKIMFLLSFILDLYLLNMAMFVIRNIRCVNIWKTEYTTIAPITPYVVHSTLAELTRIECMGVRLKEGSLIGGAGWGDVEETMREEDGTITSLLTINNLSHKRSAVTSPFFG